MSRSIIILMSGPERARCFYNKLGVSRDLQQSRSFCIVPGFSTPKWAKGAVMYQIFTDRFFNGDLTNDVENREYFYIGDGTTRVKDWDKLPAVAWHPGILRRRSAGRAG